MTVLCCKGSLQHLSLHFRKMVIISHIVCPLGVDAIRSRMVSMANGREESSHLYSPVPHGVPTGEVGVKLSDSVRLCRLEQCSLPAARSHHYFAEMKHFISTFSTSLSPIYLFTDLGSIATGTRGYPWLCVQESLPVVLREPCCGQGLNEGLLQSKHVLSPLSPFWSLQPSVSPL